jgi:hypothetical protein
MAEVPLRVDRSLLTPEQLALYDTWLEFFQHPGWKLFGEAMTPTMESNSRGYESAVGEQALGFLQGQTATFRQIFRHPSQVEASFLHLTGQLDQEVDTNDPVQPADWRV